MPDGCWVVPGLLFARGSRAVEFAEKLLPPGKPVPPGDLPENFEGVVVLCPGDPDEAESIIDVGAGVDETGKMMMVMVLPDFRFSALRGIHSFRETGDFHAGVLKAVPGYHVTCAGEEGARAVFWTCAGAMLPFMLHGMNNILARISGGIELAGYALADTEKLREKLKNASAGMKDMISFTRSMAGLSHSPGAGPGWTPVTMEEVGRIIGVFCGRSVKFEHVVRSGLPRSLGIPAGAVRGAVCLAGASAAAMVNGNGRLALETDAADGGIRVSVAWESGTDSYGMVKDGKSVAVELLAASLALSHRFGMTLTVEDWNSRSGYLSINVTESGE